MTDELDPTLDPSLATGLKADGTPMELKEVLGKTLGKEFASNEAALKAIHDTSKYVGKAGKYEAAVKAVMTSKSMTEDQAVEFIKNSANVVVPPVKPEAPDMSGFVSKAEFEEQNFYAKKPELEPYKDVIKAFKASNPTLSLEDITKLDVVKNVIDKAIAHDKITKQKSILHTNPKLQVAQDNMSKAKEQVGKGEVKQAQDNALKAVMDAFPVPEN